MPSTTGAKAFTSTTSATGEHQAVDPHLPKSLGDLTPRAKILWKRYKHQGQFRTSSKFCWRLMCAEVVQELGINGAVRAIYGITDMHSPQFRR
eukprot:7378843-Karenia_brevis.AAC.1